MSAYFPRIADFVLKERLASKGAVLLEGAKWCGKTTTASQVAGSILYMQDPARKEQNINLAKVDPLLLLEGKTPRLIDEWQLAPNLWDAVRFSVDQRNAFGQFILTGSAVPFDDMETSHSGTGRIARMRMRPMSLFESKDGRGEVSLADLFNENRTVAAKSDLSVRDLAFLICRGGWPGAVGHNEKIALQQAVDYVDGVVESDASRADGVSRQASRVRSLLRSYSRMLASDGKLTAIHKDMRDHETDVLTVETIASYIHALKMIFVIEELEAWNPNIRSSTSIRSSNTRHFVDPSIAAAALEIGPEDLLNDLKTMGWLFESLCVRDLRIFADLLNGKVYRYRDANGLECDAVVHLRDGRYGLIEIKLGHYQIDEAAEKLLKMQNIIDTSRMNNASFLMVLTGTDYAYTREDGVHVVPIACLKD